MSEEKARKKSKAVELDEAGISSAIEHANKWMQHYVQQRTEDIDRLYELGDWMYRGGTAVNNYDAQKAKFVPRMREGKSNLGSIMFHRQVNSRAAMLSDIMLSGRPLFKYRSKYRKGNPLAGESPAWTAEQLNDLADWVQKRDRFQQKIPEFCTSLFKNSTIFAHVAMKRETRTVMENKPVAVDTGFTDENGAPIIRFESRLSKSVKNVYDFPTVTFPYPKNVYADKLISRMQDQECVLILSTTSKRKLMDEGKWLDQDAVAGIDEEKMAWDGTYGGVGKNAELTSGGREEIGQAPGLLLRWDVYQWLTPSSLAENADADDEDAMAERKELYWSVYIGNELTDTGCVCVKAVTGFDPTSEIPMQEIRVCPDNADMLYHTFFAEVVESVYAAECAFNNAAVDQAAVQADPPLSIRDDLLVNVRDLAYRSGARWHVQDHDAVKEWLPKDNIANMIAMRDKMREDAQLALVTDDQTLGQYAGARTSATEVMNVERRSQGPLRMANTYIALQLLPWMAEKYKQYLETYAEPETLRNVLNENYNYSIETTPFFGEYDVLVDIIDEYMTDQEREHSLDKVIQIIGSNPQFVQSESHRINIPELLRYYLEHKHIPIARMIEENYGADSEANARARIQAMLGTGTYTPPNPGENVSVHLRVARGERLRWRGLEGADDPRAPNIPLIDEYIKDLEGLQQQGGMAAQPQQAGGQGGMELPADLTPGQEASVDQSADMGALMGGIQ